METNGERKTARGKAETHAIANKSDLSITNPFRSSKKLLGIPVHISKQSRCLFHCFFRHFNLDIALPFRRFCLSNWQNIHSPCAHRNIKTHAGSLVFNGIQLSAFCAPFKEFHLKSAAILQDNVHRHSSRILSTDGNWNPFSQIQYFLSACYNNPG